MTGTAPEAIAALPDSSGLRNRVVIPAGHAVDYGHPILTDIRLAGARPVVAGTPRECTLHALDAALTQDRIAALLLVSSRLTTGAPLDFAAAVDRAHRHGVPVIIDGAAQDMRVRELLATGADLLLFSAQKYLAGPTAGLIVGRKALIDAVRAQQRGIGRALKPTKEAIVGALAALEDRQQTDPAAWQTAQARKVEVFVARAAHIRGIAAVAEPDAAGMPFARARLEVAPSAFDGGASALAAMLKAGDPSIRVMEQALSEGALILELVPLTDAELDLVLERIGAAMSA